MINLHRCSACGRTGHLRKQHIFDVFSREVRPGVTRRLGKARDSASKALRFRAGKAAKDQLNGSGRGAPKKVKVLPMA